jgi:hypothetical protein
MQPPGRAPDSLGRGAGAGAGAGAAGSLQTPRPRDGGAGLDNAAVGAGVGGVGEGLMLSPIAPSFFSPTPAGRLGVHAQVGERNLFCVLIDVMIVKKKRGGVDVGNARRVAWLVVVDAECRCVLEARRRRDAFYRAFRIFCTHQRTHVPMPFCPSTLDPA